jgi:hypothetical protein
MLSSLLLLASSLLLIPLLLLVSLLLLLVRDVPGMSAVKAFPVVVVVVDISFVLGGSTVVGAPSVDDVHTAASFPDVF